MQPKSKDPKFCFYDIEALPNFFTISLYFPHHHHLDIYYLDDDHLISRYWDEFSQKVRPYILNTNQNLTPNVTISIHDLKFEATNHKLAKTFGIYTPDAGFERLLINGHLQTGLTPPVTDVETEKGEHHLYFMGYNSYNYDLTMLALYFGEVYQQKIYQPNTELFIPCITFKPCQASIMRAFNDELFSADFINRMPKRLIYERGSPLTRSVGQQNWKAIPHQIRKKMLQTGRHIDVARLNEKQAKVGLKRLLGMLGYQIKEADVMKKVTDINDLIDRISYNISDVINLEQLFLHPLYKSSFDLKRGMLIQYPETVFNKRTNEYAPDIYDYTKQNKPNLRWNRLSPDSSSANFAALTLSPYSELDDTPSVSFLYPAKEKAQELGIPQVDVLEEAKKFFYQHFKNHSEALAAFDRIYEFYSMIRGHNFNASRKYAARYPNNPPKSAADLKGFHTNLHYYDANGEKTSCFVTFSIGGIHGQEMSKQAYQQDLDDYLLFNQHLKLARAIYPVATDLAKAKTITLDGITYKSKQFLTPKSNMRVASYRESVGKCPKLLADDGSLNKRYSYTTVGVANHNDFTSYYPLLLVMLYAFYNVDLGYDRYTQMYHQKEEYGNLAAEATAAGDHEQAKVYTLLRSGVKLILNAASGAGDTAFDNPIRMNNQIISMRIIGQLFAWRVGQEQALKGAIVPSTNTDGLYTLLDEALNNKIVASISQAINVDIKPKRLSLITKDANTRIELSEDMSKVIDASGGGLGHRDGPDPKLLISRPAIVDWCLIEYLRRYGPNQEFNKNKALQIIKSYRQPNWPLMFQNILASSTGKGRFVYGEKNPLNEDEWTPKDEHPIILQHYNRVFYVKENAENTVHLRTAVAAKINTKSIAKRNKLNEPRVQNNALASHVLQSNGVDPPLPTSNYEAKITKVHGINQEWHCLIRNDDLHLLSSKQQKELYLSLNFNNYISLVKESYEDSWRNKVTNEHYTKRCGSNNLINERLL